MEHQAQREIERILDQVHSLDDISLDIISEPRRISRNSFVINRFTVSPAQYYEWVKKVGDDYRGVEYDAQNACLVLREHPRWMHEATTGLVNRCLDKIKDRLRAATGSYYDLMCSNEFDLAGRFAGSTKLADASLQKDGARWPVVALEVAVSESTNKLYRDAEKWLEGTQNQTKLVILVDINEKDVRNTSNDTWDLSEKDVLEMSHERLFDHISQWYRSKGIRLIGKFDLSVHLWYSDGIRQCIMNKAPFSPDIWIDPATVEDVPLRLGYLMPNGSSLDGDEPPLLFPLKNLVETLQRGFEQVENQRVGDLVKEKKKSH